ncbi:MAG: HD domain-containing protein [Clostridiales bacterium]|nr:HD domain-containing protein [Clostridiales bacterium]
MSKKQFKDPIYGYIDIDRDVVSQIIDTPAFQRLKDIRQTSYTPLYPAAYHNRYVHSLGVYHLGQIAFASIKSQLKENSKGLEIDDQIDDIQNIFETACLLHDVGHAPFSHTGEMFYLDKSETLYNNLKCCVDEEVFSEDFVALGTNKPAPHECMSCVVGIRVFSKHFKTLKERSLFARCIIGMPIRFTESAKAFYKKSRAIELLNCVISLLNSSIIDVDRLDYVIRDYATIGFQNVQIDYMRLLNGMRILPYNKHFCIGYHKSALSVIESAIYAHDAEKKWVQSHPSILYEMEVLKSAMNTLTSIFSSKTDMNPLFCFEALTEGGKVLTRSAPLLIDDPKRSPDESAAACQTIEKMINKDVLHRFGIGIDVQEQVLTREYTISLLADEDFLYLMKCFCKDSFGYEYFARNKRRIAVWKSEAEFRALFQARIGDDSKFTKNLQDAFESLVKYCQDKTNLPIVNAKIIEFLNKEEADNSEAFKTGKIDEEKYADISEGIKSRKHWTNILKDLSETLNLEFDFLIVFQKKFNSSFKEEVGEIPILFPSINNESSILPFKDVVAPLKPSVKRSSNFFHLFYRQNGSVDTARKKEIVNAIAKRLIAECIA